MKLIDFIYYMICIVYVLVLGTLWGAYIEGAEISLFVLIIATIYVITYVIKTFFDIKE